MDDSTILTIPWVKCACGQWNVVNDPKHPSRGVGGGDGLGRSEFHSYKECQWSDSTRMLAKALWRVARLIDRLALMIPRLKQPKTKTAIRLRQS